MKRFFILLVSVMAVVFSSFAVVPTSDFTKANAAYGVQDYEGAANQYEDILKRGSESSALYYNLGCAYFKLGKLAPSILNFERALLLEPGNDDVLANLEMARSKVVDEIDPVDRFFMMRIYDSICNWISSDAWAYWSLCFFYVFLIMAGLFFFSHVSMLKKVAFFTGVLAILLTVATMAFASSSKSKATSHDYAIVFESTVTVKGSPEDAGKDVFVLHEGTKVKVRRAYNKWFEIQLADGRVGWLKETAAERI
ncbi:MAG: tetratricopeptide repeat protein [Paludibacteraceae bacterium]|nr:tetratricopeptide repeat protein [Paludibacteraceae bacterium]